MKGKELDGCDAYDTEFSWVTLKVSGYNTTLPEDDIKSLMREHFSSCGEIEKVYFYKRLYDDPADVVVVTGFDTRLLSEEKIKGDLSELFSSCGKMVGVCILTDRNVKKAIISIRGEGVADKAWKLSGSDMGGWIADVVHCSPHFEKTYQRILRPRKKAKRTRK